MALLTVLVNPLDDGALLEVLKSPLDCRRGIGPKARYCCCGGSTVVHLLSSRCAAWHQLHSACCSQGAGLELVSSATVSVTASL
jgi:hypothetical protein